MGADLKRMEAALQAAADAGDTQAATLLATEMRKALQSADPSLGAPQPFRPGRESMPSMVKQEAKDSGLWAQRFAGAGAAPLLAMEGLAGMIVGDKPEDKARIQDLQALRSATPNTKMGGMGGEAMMYGGLLPSRAIGGGAKIAMEEAPAWMSGRAFGAADTAATSLGTNYALTPGDSGERLSSGIMGGILSSVAPATYALGAGARRLGTRGGKQVAVGEGLLNEAGPNAENLMGILRSADPGASLGVLSSAAMKTQNPMLEALESGARAKRGDLWRDFDKGNAKARWDSLVSKAGTQEELEGMRSALSGKTGALREQALSDAKLSTIFSQSGDVTSPMLAPLADTIKEWRVGRLRPNKDVQIIGDYVEGQLKQGVSPEQLYEVRKTLTDGIKAGRTDELSNAAKSARAQRMEIVGHIDDALNTLSGGGWKEYLSKHSAGMRPIESKQALQDIVSSLERGMPTGVIPPAMGESPAWKTVGNLRDKFGQKELGSKTIDTLLPEDRLLLNNVTDSLKRQSDSMTSRATLGSPTAGLLANAGRAEGVTRNMLESGVNTILPFGGSVLSSKVFDKLGRQAEEELAKLLQNPDALAEALASAMRARKLQAGASRVGAGVGGAYEP